MSTEIAVQLTDNVGVPIKVDVQSLIDMFRRRQKDTLVFHLTGASAEWILAKRLCDTIELHTDIVPNVVVEYNSETTNPVHVPFIARKCEELQWKVRAVDVGPVKKSRETLHNDVNKAEDIKRVYVEGVIDTIQFLGLDPTYTQQAIDKCFEGSLSGQRYRDLRSEYIINNTQVET